MFDVKTKNGLRREGKKSEGEEREGFVKGWKKNI